MKPLLKVLALLVVVSVGALTVPQVESERQAAVSFQVFYDELSPYGVWAEYPHYGYVWIPNVDRSFSPYGTDGYWVYTESGWMWVSDYPWGWAPFHYGRWAYDDSYGWIWVPRHEWGPAWVTWRRSEGYYGWAPMEPGVSVEQSFGRGHRIPDNRWIFVNDRDIGRPDIDRHYINRSTNMTIINNSTVINNTYTDNSRHATYVAGPPRHEVQAVTGTMIRPVVIRENDKPGQTMSNDQLRIYRPRVETVNLNDHKPVPSRLVTLKEVKPISVRKPQSQATNDNAPANRVGESSQPRNAPPGGTRGTGEQPGAVNPPVKNRSDQQPSQPRGSSPSGKQETDQKPHAVSQPAKAQKQQPGAVQPSGIKQKENPQQHAVPAAKGGQPPPAQPRTNPDGKENGEVE